MSRHNNRIVLDGASGATALSEVNPLRSSIFIPEHKTSIWAYQAGSTVFDQHPNPTTTKATNINTNTNILHAGVWSIPNFKLDKTSRSWQTPVELWIFYDDDDQVLDESVLRNNPLQGAWGFLPTVSLVQQQQQRRKRKQQQNKNNTNTITRPNPKLPPPPPPIQPNELVLIPPGEKPPKGLLLQGMWVKPMMKRDMSMLEEGTAGFMDISGKIEKNPAEKHSVGGAWKMLGHNDQVSRGKSKQNSAAGDHKGHWEIKVRTVQGKIFKIQNIIPGSKISHCQEQIFKKKGIVPEEQRLSFEGIPLQEQKTVIGSGIRNGDIIDLGPMEIYIRTHRGKKYLFRVDPEEILIDVKKMAAPEMKMPVEEQRLFFKWEPMSNDDAPLSLYHVKHHDILDMARMVIFVKPLVGDTVEVDVEPTDTVHQIKVKVKNRIRMPVEEQRLFFKGKELMKPKGTLDDYSIRHLDTLTMRADADTAAPPPRPPKKPKTVKSTPPPPQVDNNNNDDENDEMMIYVVQDWDDDQFSIQPVQPTDKMLQIKQQIYKLRKIPVKSQILTFQSKPVKNAKTLQESKVKHKSILHLQRKDNDHHDDDDDEPPVPPPRPPPPPPPPTTKPGNIKIEHPRTKKHFPIRIDPKTFDFPTFKNDVAKRINRPPRKFQIINDETNEPLSDDHHPPQPGTQFYIQDVEDPGQVTIQPPNGREFHLLIDPEDTIEDIKRKAAKITGFPPRLFDENGDEPDEQDKPQKGTTYHAQPPENDNTDNDNLPNSRVGTGPGPMIDDDDPPEITIDIPSNGRSFHLVIDPDDTVKDIKKKLVKLTGFPAKHLRLVNEEGIELADGDKPRPGRTFHLDPPEIEVELPDGKTTKLGLLPDMTIEDVKHIIEEETGVPKAKQRVFFFDSDKDLDDQAQVFKTGLGHGSKIGMEEIPDPEIKISMPGRSFNLEIIPDDTVKDIKKKLVKLTGFPAKHLRLVDEDGIELADGDKPRPGRTFHLDPPEIEVELPDGKTTKLGLLPDMTIEDVKHIIEEETGVPKAKQRVFFFDSDKDLDDQAQVFKTGLGHGSKIGMEEIPDPEIKVSMPGRSFNLEIIPDDTVKDIKKKLVKLTGFPAKHLRLVDEDGIELADGDKPRPGRTFHLDPPEIEVELPDGKTTKLGLLPDMTIEDVKHIIEEETGVPKAKQRVFFFDSDKDLDDQAQVFKTGLKHGSKLQMEEISEPSEPEITIKMPNGRSFTLVIDPDDSSKDIKKKIAKLAGVPSKDLRLSFDDDEIEDGFDPSCLSRGDVLTVEPAKVEVALPDGQRIKLSILPSTTMDELKEMVEEKTGTPKSRVFFFDNDGNELDDTIPVARTGLELGSALEMRLPESKDPEVTFKTREGRTFVLVITPEDTVKDVKKKLREKSKLEVGSFKLGDLDFEDVDDDEVFLDADPTIRQGGVLLAEPPKVEIEVPGVAKKIKMAILPTTTIADVKKVIEEQIPEYKEKKQRMFFFDNNEELDDDAPFKKLDFEKGMQLEIRDFQIQVEHWKGGKVSLDVQTTEYVGDVKEKIFKIMQIHVEQQNLTFKGKPVREDVDLKNQKIGPGSLIKLKPMKVIVTVPDGSELSFTVEIDDSITKLKKKIAKKTQTPTEVQCILSGSTEFENKQTLEDCGVRHEDTLTMELFRVDVMDWHGDSFTVRDLQPSDPISDLKSKIQDINDIPPHMQQLTHNGRVIEDEGTLKEKGIKHRAVLVLEDPSEVDFTLPESDQVSLHISKTKKFKSKEEEIWPVVPDWSKRIFFFDNDESLDDGLVELTVMHWTGKSFVLDQIRLGIKLDELKKSILQLKKIPISKQSITFNGKLLDANRTLRQQMVKHKSVLVLEGKSEVNLELPDSDKISFGILPSHIVTAYEVVVKHWQGDEYTIQAEPTDYVDDLKETILENLKIPTEQQRISFKGEQVSDTENLIDQGITSGSLLVLEPMEIGVETPSGEELHLKVEVDDTIRRIKKMIFQKTEVPVRVQCIMFGGEELKDSQTLEECQVEHEDLLQMELFSLNVMHFTGEVFVVTGILPIDTTEDLKAEIFRIKHVPKKKQLLTYQGKPIGKNRTLEDEGIHHKSVLILEEAPEEDESTTRSQQHRKISLFAGLMGDDTAGLKSSFELTIEHWNGDTFTIQCDPNEYADDLKEKIQKQRKIPLEQQILSFEGMAVRDDENLQAQKIENGSTLKLEPMRIYVEEPSGSKITLEVEQDFTIRTLKRLLQEQDRAPGDEHCLMLGGQELEDGKTLEDYEIRHEDTVALEFFKIAVMDESGISFDVENVSPQDTFAKVKQEILALKSIPKSDQRLSYQGKVLSDKKTLADEGIRHKTVIILEEVEGDMLSPKTEKFKLSFRALPSAMDTVLSAKSKNDGAKKNLVVATIIDDDDEEDGIESIGTGSYSEGSSTNSTFEESAKAEPSSTPKQSTSSTLSSKKSLSSNGTAKSTKADKMAVDGGGGGKWWDKQPSSSKVESSAPLRKSTAPPEKKQPRKISFLKKKEEQDEAPAAAAVVKKKEKAPPADSPSNKNDDEADGDDDGDNDKKKKTKKKMNKVKKFSSKSDKTESGTRSSMKSSSKSNKTDGDGAKKKSKSSSSTVKAKKKKEEDGATATTKSTKKKKSSTTKSAEK